MARVPPERRRHGTWLGRSTAERLESTYREDAARLGVGEPWFGEIAVRTSTRTIAHRVGKRDDRNHRIVDWRHPYGKAYYALTPGEEFDMEDFAEDAAFARIRGVCEHQAQVTGPGGSLERVMLRVDGRQ